MRPSTRWLASGTAIADGLRAGLGTLDDPSPMPPPWRPAPTNRRLLLISDGQANVGPRTAEEIVASLPRSAQPVTMSTLGVGTDYDEETLLGVARVSGGSFHHLTDPVQLGQILDEELRKARAVVAEGAVIELWPEAGVTVLDAPGVQLTRDASGMVRIGVGALYAGERRTLAIPVRVPSNGDGAVDRVAARLRISYRAAGGAGGTPMQRELSVGYSIKADAGQASSSAAPELQVAADRLRVAHVLTDAAALIREGDLLEAQAILRDERGRIEKRRDRLSGADRAEVELLVGMLRDPFVDADLSARAPAAAAEPDRFAATVEKARKGDAVVDADLAGLDRDRLRLLRNAPYARHGYAFKAADVTAWFKRQGWWRADPAFDERRLTSVDVDTIALVRAYENWAQVMTAVRVAAGAGGAVKGPGLDVLVDRARAGQPLAAADLVSLDLGQLRTLRNAAYARHGYQFRAADLQAAFTRYPWYHPDDGFNESPLDAGDHANIDLVRAREREVVGRADGGALRDFELRSRAGAYRALHG